MYTLEDKKKIIGLKNQLIHGTEEELKEMYSNEEDYALFIDTLNITLDTEPIFFMMDESIIKKAESVLYNKRFDYKTKEFVIVINEIISRINKIKTTPEATKIIQCRQYVIWQQTIRETSFIDKNTFLQGMAYDAILMDKLEKRNIEDTEMLYFFSSTTFLSKALPEFYQEDKKRIDITIEKLEEHAKKRWIWNWPERSFAKATLKNIQKVKIKEE